VLLKLFLYKQFLPGKMRKLTALVLDGDEVGFDFNPELFDWHNQEYNTDFKLEDITEWDFTKLWGVDSTEARLRVQQFYCSLGFPYMNAVEGAIEGIAELSEYFEMQGIVTARAYTAYSLDDYTLDMHAMTRFQADRLFEDYIDFVRLTNAYPLDNTPSIPKSQVCQEYNASIIIDDAIHNILDCVNNFNMIGILLSRNWNKEEDTSHPRIERALDWHGNEGVIEIIKQYLS